MQPLPEHPSVVCLCPVYGVPPHLIANAIACFLAQDYAGPKFLLLSDDLGNIAYNDSMHTVDVVSTPERYPSLPAKYNAMRKLAMAADVIVVWEADDIYLPHHISSNVAVLRIHEWAHPTDVWSTYTGAPQIEGAAGRFHASLAFRRSYLDRIGGWPETDSPDFDQRLLRVAAQNAPCGRPDSGEGKYPSYVFRWADTAAVHGQSTMGSGVEWYRSYRPQYTKTVWVNQGMVQFDAAAVRTLASIQTCMGSGRAGDASCALGRGNPSV